MRVLRSALIAACVLAPTLSHAQAMKAAAPAPAALNDAAIVGIFDAANSWDISTGSLAATKATRADVKDFGKMLSQVHATVRQQGRDLAKKLGVTPTPVPANFALLLDYTATMKKLNSLSGPAFDTAFLQHEVAYHKAVIDAVTNTFLPAIQNAELKSFVSGVAPAFTAHMQLAQQLLDKK